MSTRSEYRRDDLAQLEQEKAKGRFFRDIGHNIRHMPRQMRRIGVVQFFSWFAFFAMWSMATPALTEHVFKAPAPQAGAYDMAVPAEAAAFAADNKAFQDAADLVGVAMGWYGLSSMVVALLLAFYAARFVLNRRLVHGTALVVGGVGFLGMYAVESLWLLKLCFVGVGVAWASILSMPYALLAGCLEEKRMGVFMGLFNMFIVLPQITAALGLGPVVREAFGNHAIYALMLSGASLLLAAAFVIRVRENPALEPIPEPGGRALRG